MNEEPLALPIIEVTESLSSVWPESPVSGVETSDCVVCGCLCCCECDEG